MSDNPSPAMSRPWLGLSFIALGVSLIMLDTTVVNVALPWMAFDLGFTTSDTQWVVAAYSLSFASFLIIAGRLADGLGRRRMFVIGALVFTIASAWIGLATSTSSVVAGRFAQGIGAAIIMPSSLSLINATFTGRDRARAFALWGGTIGGMAAVGPVVGGWLTSYHTWHWAFFLSVPVSLIAMIGVATKMPESRDEHLQPGYDIGGMVLSSLGLSGIVFALIEGQRYGWVRQIADFSAAGFTWHKGSLAVSLIAALLGVAAIAGFVLLEIRRHNAGLPVLLRTDLFAIASFRNGNVVAVIVSLGEFGLLYVLPLFVQGTLGYDPLQTGVLMLALAAGSFLTSGASTHMAERMGAVRVLRIGMALEALAIAGIGLVLTTDSTRATLAPWIFVYGLGIGFATAQLTGVILRDVPREVSGQASAIQSTSRQMGAAVGTAILGTVLASATNSAILPRLDALHVATAKAHEYADFVTDTAGQLIQFLILQPNGKSIVEAAHEAFASGTRAVSVLATAFVLFGLFASFRLPVRSDAESAAE